MKPHRLVFFAASFCGRKGCVWAPSPSLYLIFLPLCSASFSLLTASSPLVVGARRLARLFYVRSGDSGDTRRQRAVPSIRRPVEVAKMIRRGCWPRFSLLPSLHLSPCVTSPPHPRLMLCLLFLLRYKTEQGRKAAGKVVRLGRGGYQSAGCGQVMI